MSQEDLSDVELDDNFIGVARLVSYLIYFLNILKLFIMSQKIYLFDGKQLYYFPLLQIFIFSPLDFQ